MNWYYQTLNPEAGEALAEVKKSNVAVLPILVPAASDGIRNALAVQVSESVSAIMELNNRLAGTKTPDEVTRLVRRREATDRRIDQLVYELYGLTDAEVAIVEPT